MKLLLIDNLILPQEGSLAHLDVHPHLGLLALAAVAEAGGHGVEIYDPKRLIRSGALSYDAGLYERAAEDLLARDPDAVGFTTLGCSFLFALNVAAELKRREPDLPILLGGPHATMLHDRILGRFPQFDVIVRHEADEIFPAVLDALGERNFRSIPGVSWRARSLGADVLFTEGKPKVEDLDGLPIASYDHYPIRELGLALLRIEAGRGCPFVCTFCSTAGFFQRSFRLKSAGRLVKELDLLHAAYGFTEFKLDHDLFTVNRRKVIEFCDAVKGRGYRWHASARVDCVDEELLARMAEAGCVNLYFGMETGSARMQKICQKNLDLALVEPTLVAAENVGIQTTASFITGFPEEEEDDQDETLDLLGRCTRTTCLAQLHILAPEPGTPMFERHGGRLAYDGYGGPYNTELIGENDGFTVLEHPHIFQTYHYYPAVMDRRRYVFAVEAVSVLRRVGPLVMSYLLRAYDGRLSRLIQALRCFADALEGGGLPDADLWESYIAAAFGPSHHMSSLFRFGLRVNRGGFERAVPAAPQGGQDWECPYRLSDGVDLMRDIHDCRLLLERIAASGPGPCLIDPSETGERGTYLLNEVPGGTRTYRIDPGVEAILTIFRTPRRWRDVAKWCRAAGVEGLEPNFFHELVREEILVPSRDRVSGKLEGKTRSLAPSF